MLSVAGLLRSVFPLRDTRSHFVIHCQSFSSEEEDDDWCPPLPARTYLMDASREEISSLPSKADDLSYAATLMAFPQRDTHKPGDSLRLHSFDLLTRQHLGSQVSQSNPDLFTNTKARDVSGMYHTNQWADSFKGESYSKGNRENSFKPHIFGNDFPKTTTSCHV